MSTQKAKRYFVTDKDSISVYENNLVTLTLSTGESFEALEPRRLFPVSTPSEYISLITEKGTEVAVIKNLKDLNGKSLEVIEASLRDYYLVPYITRIISLVEKNGTYIMRAKTNRGEKAFEVRDRNHDIKVHKDGTVRIRDADDNRYVISDYKKLDKHSLHFLISDI